MLIGLWTTGPTLFDVGKFKPISKCLQGNKLWYLYRTSVFHPWTAQFKAVLVVRETSPRFAQIFHQSLGPVARFTKVPITFRARKAVVRALASYQCGTGSNLGGWVCLLLVLSFAPRDSGYSGFPLSSKTNISKFQFDQESGNRKTTLWMCYL